MPYQIFKQHTNIMYQRTCWAPNLTLSIEKFKKVNHFNHSVRNAFFLIFWPPTYSVVSIKRTVRLAVQSFDFQIVQYV